MTKTDRGFAAERRRGRERGKNELNSLASVIAGASATPMFTDSHTHVH